MIIEKIENIFVSKRNPEGVVLLTILKMPPLRGFSWKIIDLLAIIMSPLRGFKTKVKSLFKFKSRIVKML